MTYYEIEAAESQKRQMIIKQRGRCHYCGKSFAETTPEAAHRIAKSKWALAKYGPEVIHHRLNMVITCRDCNDKALLNPCTHPIEAEDLIKKILEDLNNEPR